ncbi:hypothetical protein H112_05177 [Trichophyton rubrum D6]|uniref:Uncharacterized protein n=3 Tax=Trichophyton TaxID=5550 RepID=A0A080WFE8_TRIRC|nr:uncharacterized protein TERG_11919 [Trichophyton rubrum CBS 118892]EZF21193.1 hypothetical protein H100_05199 [Trichophyton rubrum MR850]EZF40908.1 hypothetical protein H102_05186 [Trichophyton rubrum CBS 100081]EZF51702.1 hypothetical protein H103_05187 [Trichophyton rubrum CBS 288.86]EZF62110.1 hypothetical protein H104_05180 [Trichophyton rubrum CBS 289.86]EZF72949.1 hypothetical protein H105_05208 [Trichophyton soudanense CBS 452.61]EZF83358.1 hypothetical protein H110_05186 [Trichophy
MGACRASRKEAVRCAHAGRTAASERSERTDRRRCRSQDEDAAEADADADEDEEYEAPEKTAARTAPSTSRTSTILAWRRLENMEATMMLMERLDG